MPFTKRRLPQSDRRAIRDRLADFQRRRYDTVVAMANDAGVKHNTVGGWLHPDPATPDTVALVKLAHTKNVNLNWLLLGEGPELRGIDAAGDVWHLIRQALVAELIGQGIARPAAVRLVGNGRALLRRNLKWLQERAEYRPTGTKRASISDALTQLLRMENETTGG
jgi:hypothetical protein